MGRPYRASPRTSRQDPRQALLRVLRLERERGYANRSVVGGLDRLLERQGPRLASPLQGLALPDPSYAAMSPSQRRRWVQGALQVLGGLAPPKGAEYQKPGPSHRPPQRAPTTSPSPHLTLDSPVSQLKSVTGRVAEKLERLGLQTLRDLVYHFPRRYNEVRGVAQLRPAEEEQAAVVTLWSASAVTVGRRMRATEAVVGDETGNIRVIWFNQPYLANRLKPNSRLLLSGRVSVYQGQPSFDSPEHEAVARGAPALRPGSGHALEPGHLLPVYPSTEGLTQRTLRRVVGEALEVALPQVQAELPARIRERLRLLDLREALAQAHYADDWKRLEAARRRLAFDELFLLQLWVLGHRREWRAPGSGVPLPRNQRLLDAFFSSLPFQLTEAQGRVLGEILGDMEQPVPMSRLLHGEVGSGKTAVAVAALLTTAAHGYQGALMAPTEILAEQHFLTIATMLEGFAKPWQQRHSITFYLDPHPQPISIGLLVGSMPRREKEETYQRLAEGSLDIVVGTHALIQEEVAIPRLGLAVVDEQHRFGVLQRSSLRQRAAEGRPHLLVMSATPIPRTLALTLYGDLDVSVIDQLPPGRQQVRTRWARPHQRQATYDFLRRQVEQGRQAFVICPLIEESEALQVRAATEEYERLSHEVYPDLRLGLLHGRMPTREKSQVMEAFRQGELNILVSTPVVEVGVDVPNATVMLIEGADRFGLAQLHQFRGRVGRGQHPSYCLLLAESPSAEAQERLSIVERTADGFALAEEDLRLRGPGDYAGVRQSGMPDLRMARLSDQQLLSLARREAAALLEQDPHLERPEHRLLKEALARSSQERTSVGELS